MARWSIAPIVFCLALLAGCAAGLEPTLHHQPLSYVAEWTGSISTKEGTRKQSVLSAGVSRFAEPRVVAVANSSDCSQSNGARDEHLEVIYFGTNRKEVEQRRVGYGKSDYRGVRSFGVEQSAQLVYGCAYINIPQRARGSPAPMIVPSEIQQEIDAIDEKFFVRDVRSLDRASFSASVREAAERAQVFKRQVLVIVHGFNNSFESTLVRAAQLKHDMDFDGPVVVFAWPSRGDNFGYVYDRGTADSSVDDFLKLLDALPDDLGKESINILAHSMGGRLLLSALDKAIGETNGSKYTAMLRELLLAAPAVDWVFFNKKMERIKFGQLRVSVYCSKDDIALQTAEVELVEGKPMVGRCPLPAAPVDPQHDNPHHARLDYLNIAPASNCEELWHKFLPAEKLRSIFKIECTHSAYALNGPVIADMNQLILARLDPQSRSGAWTKQHRVPELSPRTGYYVFRP